MYELLTGHVPFEGPDTFVLAHILFVEPAPPSRHRPDLDPLIEAICLKAMAKVPEDRYATMSEFATALADYLRLSVICRPGSVGSPLRTCPSSSMRARRGWCRECGRIIAPVQGGSGERAHDCGTARDAARDGDLVGRVGTSGWRSLTTSHGDGLDTT